MSNFTLLNLSLALVIISVFTAAWISPISGGKIKPHYEPLSDELINYINEISGTTWKAAKTDRFRSVADIKKVLGVLRNKSQKVLPRKWRDIQDMDIPDAFDSRTHWSFCKSMSQIRDQSGCGSCWAFATVEAISDRICVKSNGTNQVYISAEDLMSCCSECGEGCKGGDPTMAWEYYVTSGIVTGGLYKSNQGCQDYPFPPCAHHINTTQYPPCPKDDYKTPTCKTHCQSGYDKSYLQDKHYAISAYGINMDVKQIQAEIMLHGPVGAAFDVYEDFVVYKSGVYQHVTGKYEGGHAVKILGWGKENGIPYWLVANSWNPSWGDQGYFKMLRGRNECGIESDIVAGIPK